MRTHIKRLLPQVFVLAAAVTTYGLTIFEFASTPYGT
jgi:hypothetical protein